MGRGVTELPLQGLPGREASPSDTAPKTSQQAVCGWVVGCGCGCACLCVCGSSVCLFLSVCLLVFVCCGVFFGLPPPPPHPPCVMFFIHDDFDAGALSSPLASVITVT